MDILSYIMSMLEINKVKQKIKEYDLAYDAKESILKWIVNGEQTKSFILSGAGNPNGTTISVRTSNSSIAEVLGNKIEIDFTFTSIYSDGESTGDGSMTISVDGIKQIVGQPIPQGENKIDVTKYLKIGNHSVVVEVSDSKGNSDSCKIAAQVISLTISSDYIATIINNKELQYPFMLSGTGDKTVYAYLDGTLLSKTTITTTGVTSYLTIPIQKHGAHLLKLYAEATVNSKVISSNILYSDIIFTEINNTAPIIASNFTKSKSDQYDTISIPYIIYDPASLKSAVTLYVNGDLVSTLPNIDRTLHVWNYRTSKFGPIKFEIKCGDTTKTFNIDIEKLPVDIGNISGAELYFTAADGDNNSQDRDKWSYTDSNGVKTSMAFSDNFDWDNGGFRSDDDGDPVFRIKAGTSITIPKKILADDARTHGKTVKFIFKASNCRTYDADVLKCMSGKKGLSIKAQSATFTSEQTNTLVQYCEDRYVELEFVISKSTGYRYIIPYLSAVPAKVGLYPSTDDFAQVSPSDIVIGSSDCDVDFYMFSSYNFALQPKEVLSNFIADAKNSTQMIERYSRNNIYDDNNEIDLDKLPTSIKYTIFSAERLTTSKKDKVPCSVVHVDKTDSSKSFTASGATFKGQGTSSAAYGEAGLNLDISYGKGFTVSDTGEHIDAYKLSEDSIPVNYFNYKVNIASSENANNACVTAEYEKFNPYTMVAKKANPKVRGTVEAQQDLLFFHDTTTNKRSFYGIANMCNSKKNLAVFGHDKETYPSQACVEFANNTSLRCLWKTGDFDGWEDDFEFRYPEEPTEEDVNNLRRVVSWVASTDRTAATNSALSSIQMQEITKWNNPKCTETKDTIEYRSAKFTNQFDDYFIKQSALYYYIFTERHSMVDSRAKNLFPQTDDGIHWHFSIDYDNDTAEGNNNEGDLILPYGCEDTDSIGSKDVFNGADSVLWCNIRDLMSKELGEMFRDRETSGAWDADRFCKFIDDFQSAYPEALWIEDFQKKYLNPYENSGTMAYLTMAYGKKTDQRYWWEHYQEPYMSSKYSGSACLNNVATLRCYTPKNWTAVEPNGDMVITPYSDLYISVKYASYTVIKRAKRGVPTVIKCPLDSGMNDTETYIYCSSYLSDIGDLSALYVGYCNIASMVKLQSLTIGSIKAGYGNTNMQTLGLGNNTLLKTIELENLPSLTQTIDAANCDSLEVFKSYGSPLAGASFSKGGKLKQVEMESPSVINIKNQKHLVSYKIKNYTPLSTMVIENTPLDSLAILQSAKNINRIRLIGVNWVLENTDILDTLLKYHGIDENGMNTQNPVLSGTIYINMEMNRSDMIYYEDTFTDLIVECKTVVEDLLLDHDANALTDSNRNFLGVVGGTYTSAYTYEDINNMIKEMEG